MTWREAIKASPEGTAVLVRGNFSYLKYPTGTIYHASSGDFKIKEKCHEHVDGNWQPLGLRIK